MNVEEFEIIGAYATARVEIDVTFDPVARGRIWRNVNEVISMHQTTDARTRFEDMQGTGRIVLAAPTESANG